MIRDQRTFGNSRFLFTLARPEAVDYSRDKFPGTYEAARFGVLVLPLNEKYTDQHVNYVIDSIRDAATPTLQGLNIMSNSQEPVRFGLAGRRH